MPSVAQLALPPVIAIDLCGVMMFDAGDELVEHIDELRGGLVGEAPQVERHDERFALHRTAA